MNHSFPHELQELLHEGLASGQYGSEEEMLLEAVRLLRQRDADVERFEQGLKARLRQLDRGEGIELEDDEALRSFFDDIQARGRQRFEARQSAS